MAAPLSDFQKDYLNDTSQYDLARKRARDQSQVDLQNRKDALQRRFASLGNLDSGVALKQQELAANDVANDLTNQNQNIDAQQNADLAQRKGVILGQQFQTSERQASQDYATSERLGSQDFAAGEAAKNRAVQEEQFAKTYGLSKEQFAAAKEQWDKSFTEEQYVNRENVRLADEALGKKGFLDGLISDIGLGNSTRGLTTIGGGVLGGMVGGPVGAVVGAGAGSVIGSVFTKKKLF